MDRLNTSSRERSNEAVALWLYVAILSIPQYAKSQVVKPFSRSPATQSYHSEGLIYLVIDFAPYLAISPI